MPAPASRARSWWPYLLAAGWLAQAVLRWWLSRGQVTPVAFPDEAGYLLAARWLGGGAAGDLSTTILYPAGYPLLLAPQFKLSHDPETIYRGVLALNAVVGAALFPMSYVALRRLGLDRVASYALGHAAALVPPTVFFAQFALADALLPVLVLGWLLCLHRFLETGGASWAVAGGAVAAYASATHARGTVVLGVHVVVLAAAFAWRWAARRAAASSLGAAAAVFAAGTALNAALARAVYPGGVRDLSGVLSERLSTVDGQARALSWTAGQLWSLGVGTWGLAALGIAAASYAGSRGSTPRPLRVAAAALLVTSAAIAYGSAASLPGEGRVGHYVYGRYLACVAVPFALAGLAVLARHARRWVLRTGASAAALVGGTALVVALNAGDRLGSGRFVPFDLPEASFLAGDWDSFHLVRVTLVAVGLLAALLALALLRKRAIAIALAVLAIDVAAAASISANLARPATARFVAATAPPVSPGERIAVDERVSWKAWIPMTPAIWWSPVERYDGATAAPPAGVCVVIAPAGEGPRGPWRLAKVAEEKPGWSAWRSAGCPAR